MGVQFANSIFAIIAPIAAIVPILIHLLALRRRQHVAFTMLHLLERAALQASGMRRLREWLIVLARSLSIFFLFIALSQPLVWGVRFTALRGDASICILMDDTASMSFLEGTESRFELARKCAEELIRSMPNARFCVVSLSQPDKVVCHWTSEAGVAEKALKSMRVKLTQGSVRRALLKAFEVFERVDSVSKHLFIFTDGQIVPTLCRVARDLCKGEDGLGGVRGRLNVTVVDVRRSLLDVNVAPVDWDVDVNCLSSPPSAALKLVLRNFGSRSWKGSISTAVDGKPVSELKEVTIAPMNELSLAIPINLGSGGWHQGLVSWQDMLPIDNRLRFAFYNPLPIRTLCIGSWSEGGNAFYVAKALESIRESLGANSIIVSKSLSMPHSLDELIRWHVLIWCHPRPMAKSAEENLRAWLSSGGVLIAFVDRQAIGMPRWLFPMRAKEGHGNEPLRIFASDVSHPISHRIPSEQLDDVLVFEHVVADEASAGRVILRFDDGSPALTENRFGSGIAITFWMGADTKASTLPTSIAFVPLLCELIQYAVMKSHAAIKVIGDGSIEIEHKGASSLSSTAVVSNVDTSDSDVRIPSHEELRRIVARVGWGYVTLQEWLSRRRIDVPVNATMLFIALCIAMLLAEAALQVQWVKRRRH